MPGGQRQVSTLYLAGLLAGAASTASFVLIAVAVVHDIVPAPFWLILVLAISVVGLLGDANVIPRLLPSAKRLIPQWVAANGRIGIVQFGFEMGTGARTYSPTYLPHIVLLWSAVYSNSVVDCIAVSMGFALGRWIPFIAVHGKEMSAQDRVERVLRQTPLHGLTIGCLAVAFVL